MRVFAVLTLVTAVSLPVLASAQTQPAAADASAPMAVPAMQSQMAQTAAPAAATSGYNGDEVICRMSPPTTGTRLGGGRECHARREWDQRTRDAQDATRAMSAPGALKGGN